MDSFKVIVDTLSSLAAIVAIATVLVAWVRSRKPPIHIPRLIISPAINHFRAFIEIKNTKLYPVTIDSYTCYRKSSYQIYRKKNEKPSMYPSFDTADRLFSSSDSISLTELGEYKGEMYFSATNFNRQGIIFILHSSHGHFHLRPRNVEIIEDEFRVVEDGEATHRNGAISARLEYIKGYALYIYEYLNRPLF